MKNIEYAETVVTIAFRAISTQHELELRKELFERLSNSGYFWTNFELIKSDIDFKECITAVEYYCCDFCLEHSYTVTNIVDRVVGTLINKKAVNAIAD